jgi:hypothetical protein
LAGRAEIAARDVLARWRSIGVVDEVHEVEPRHLTMEDLMEDEPLPEPGSSIEALVDDILGTSEQ